MKANRNTQKGFTLIELIVILAILGISFAIAVPNFMVVQTNSEFRADLATIEMIEKTEANYHALYHTHSFNESVEQTPDNFHESLSNLSGLLHDVTFKTITDVHWFKEEERWKITYNTSQYNSDSGNTGDGEYPEWDPNKNNYVKGDRVMYNGHIFEARWWTNSEPGIDGHPWDEITHEWRSFNVYWRNDTVEYDGHTYRATQWTQNNIPDNSSIWELVN